MQLREIFPNELIRFETLLNKSFPVIPGSSFFDDFPIWSQENSHIKRIGYFYNNNLIAAGAIRYAQNCVDENQFQLGMIGAICTDTAYRGRGLASEIIAKLLTLKESDAYILWGSEFKLYHRFGFKLCGHQARISLSNLQIETLINNHQIQQVSADLVFPLRQSKPEGLRLDALDRSWFISHKNTEFIGAININSQQLDAYVAIGKGIDLPNMIHEWGGNEAALDWLLVQIKKDRPHLELLFHPIIHTHWLTKGHTNLIQDQLCMARFENAKAENLMGGFWFWGLDSL